MDSRYGRASKTSTALASTSNSSSPSPSSSSPSHHYRHLHHPGLANNATVSNMSANLDKDMAKDSLASSHTSFEKHRMAGNSLGNVSHNDSSSSAMSQQWQLPLRKQRSHESTSGGSFLQSTGTASSLQVRQSDVDPYKFPSDPIVPSKTPNYAVSKKRAPPAPLDLSPPRPSWLHSEEQHPIIRSPSSANNLSNAKSSIKPLDRSASAYDTSTNTHFSPDESRSYAGLGLGLPFSNSESTGSISSMPTSESVGDFSKSYVPSLPPSSSSSSSASSIFARIQRKPSPGDVLGSPESPVTDRRGLVGLGELSTPRWTAAIHERKWGHQPLPSVTYNADLLNQKPGNERGWEGDVLSRYTDEKKNGYHATDMKMLPGANSYNSFSNISPAVNGGISQSSSTYSLDALSLPDSNYSGSEHEPGSRTFYTPSFTANPQYSAYASITSPQFPLQDHIKSQAEEREAERTLRNFTTSISSTVRPHSVQTPSRNGSRNHSRTSSSEKPQRETPSYMRSTHASSTRRNSGTNAIKRDEVPTYLEPSVSNSDFNYTMGLQKPPSRPAIGNSPLTSLKNSRQGHRRQSSNIVKGSIPPPINTSRSPEMATSQNVRSGTQQSPSAIAHSILRSTRGSHMEGVDISAYAAADESTADALRKLDGISNANSPRPSGALPHSRQSLSSTAKDTTPRRTSGSTGLSRQNSKTSQRPSSPHSRPSSTNNKSWGKHAVNPSINVAGDYPANRQNSAVTPQHQPISSLSSGFRRQSLSASISAPTLAIASSSSSPQSSANNSKTFTSPAPRPERRASGTRPSFSGAELPPTPSLSSKRSSSTSLAIGPSIAGSRESTSATSLSTYGSPAHPERGKGRRGSNSSEASSMHSTYDAVARSENSEIGERSDLSGQRAIPPVPPLPKDWEAYRPFTAGESLPNSAKDSFLINSLRDQSPKSPALSEGLNNSASGRSSSNRPLGPRPLRNVSATSSTFPESLPSTPPLPNDISGVDGMYLTSKTPTRTKWSLSNALGINRSPHMTSSASSSSFNSFKSATGLEEKSLSNESAPNERQSRLIAERISNLATSTIGGSLPRRKLSSVPDLHSLSGFSSKRLESVPRAVSTSSRDGLRSKTDSLKTGSTDNTVDISAAMAKPAETLPSPGRSRSTLLSPRRTPSGIPFLSRRPSTQNGTHQQSTTLLHPSVSAPGSSVVPEPSTPSTISSHEEKTGRKSILGIHLFSRASARKSVSGPSFPLSPKIPLQYALPSDTAMKPTTREQLSEFGVRPSQDSKRSSMSTRASNLIGRKRGKTLPSSADSPVKQEAIVLPPMQMNALPASTVSRLETLSVDERAWGSAQKQSLLAPPRQYKAFRAVEASEGKSVLPTINGSPSVDVDAYSNVREINNGSPKPSTPTRIPRLVSNRSNGPSPQQLVSSFNQILDTSAAESSHRRGSLAPGAGMSSSMPQQSSNLSLAQDSVNSFNSDPYLSSPGQGDPTGSSSDSGLSGTSGHQNRQVYININSASTPVKTFPTLLPTSRSFKVASLTSAAKNEKRRSLLQLDERDSKTARTPLRTSHGMKNHNGMKSTSSTSTETASVATTNRSRTKAEEIAAFSPSDKASIVSEGLPPPKAVRNLASKLSIPSRISRSSTTPSLSQNQSPFVSDTGSRSTSSSQYSTLLGEEEVKADEEMIDFVRRQRGRKASSGMSEGEIGRLFDFPESIEPRLPLSPESAAVIYVHHLSDYERDEIYEYQHLFYIGDASAKKMAVRSIPTNNYGYDDERGDYQIVERDHISFRFEIIDTLGKGSFGQVLRCRDHKTGDMVAVKIIRNKKRFHHQALVEIKVLENLKRWDPEERNNLLKIGDHFTFRGHLCITTELLSINLYELIKANSFHGFSTNLIRRFTAQIVAALSLLRHHRVVHCDLKPENLLLKHPTKSAVKVIDFGSSCFENEKVYTYIQSRFYRSPEVILGMNYHMAIDMWSLGCIIAELYTGYPIFPGENEASQLACMMEVLGVPDKNLVDKSSRKKLFFDSTGAPRPTVDSKGRRRRPGAKTLSSVLKCDDELFIDFISKCLTWDPDKRLKPGPALRHPFCAKSRAFAPAASLPTRHSANTQNLVDSAIPTPLRLDNKILENL